MPPAHLRIPWAGNLLKLYHATAGSNWIRKSWCVFPHLFGADESFHANLCQQIGGLVFFIPVFVASTMRFFVHCSLFGWVSVQIHPKEARFLHSWGAKNRGLLWNPCSQKACINKSKNTFHLFIVKKKKWPRVFNPQIQNQKKLAWTMVPGNQLLLTKASLQKNLTKKTLQVFRFSFRAWRSRFVWNRDLPTDPVTKDCNTLQKHKEVRLWGSYQKPSGKLT